MNERLRLIGSTGGWATIKALSRFQVSIDASVKTRGRLTAVGVALLRGDKMNQTLKACPNCNGTGKTKWRLGSMVGRDRKGNQIIQNPGPGLPMKCSKCDGTGLVPSSGGTLIPPSHRKE